MDTILRRMPDYVNYIGPQFSRTHINFQRVPTVDTSNPFIAKDIPTADESFLIVRFANPKGIDFPYLLSMIHDSFMSRPNTLVRAGRQAAARDADHPDAADPADDGHEEAGVLTPSADVARGVGPARIRGRAGSGDTLRCRRRHGCAPERFAVRSHLGH